jgi:fucose 4-O-acetylase-like acetyltransferase
MTPQDKPGHAAHDEPIATDRLHALDNLRAIMMWLGIVIHVSVNHLTGKMLMPWRDDATSQLADVLVGVIHVFRMPLFLMLAGFFVALLVQRHGAAQMLRHRMRRVALPFVVFWPVIFALTGVLAMAYVHKAKRGDFGLDEALMPAMPHIPLVNTMHLWFLYQLVGLVLLTYALLKIAPSLPPGMGRFSNAAFKLLGTRTWGFAVLALPLAVIGAQDAFGVLAVSGSFAPPLGEWLHHGLFYAFGYFLYAQREHLFEHFKATGTRHFAQGALLCFVSLGLLKLVQSEPDVGLLIRLAAAWTYNAATWLWCFALLGFALRHLNHQNRVLKYLADSSYWVYLVHMLGTIGFGALLYGAALSAEIKMLMNMAATTAFGLITYQVLVRNTAVGRLLNGKRHSTG